MRAGGGKSGKGVNSDGNLARSASTGEGLVLVSPFMIWARLVGWQPAGDSEGQGQRRWCVLQVRFKWPHAKPVSS